VVCFGGFLPYVHGLHFLFVPPRVIIGHQAMPSTVLYEYYCLSVCLSLVCFRNEKSWGACWGSGWKVRSGLMSWAGGTYAIKPAKTAHDLVSLFIS
jgi:hypothetical protein